MATSTTVEPSKIDGEHWREYVYPDGTVYRITDPLLLFIFEGKSGWTQRVVDRDYVVHRPKPGWNAIRWKMRVGQPYFTQ